MPRTFALVLLFLISSGVAAADARPNVLFIAVDDLRPQLACYGREQMHSPNIDRLASQGILFEHAYCMVPTCGASRASVMTGIRPARKRFVNYLTWAEKDAPGITTLNTHFKNSGYYTVSLGKIFHHRKDSDQGWSEQAWLPNKKHYQLSASETLRKDNPRGKGPAVEAADVPDVEYRDGQIAERAIQDLKRLKTMDQPFFLAVGFYKPHLPFVAPQKYWDLYDRNEIEIPENYHPPKNAPKGAVHNFGELRSYHGIPKSGILSEEKAKELIHGYYACVSFADAQIGKVLDGLKRLELEQNTIVVLWGDHGWNLGDHTMWCKHSCFESSLHAPLIVKTPGIDGGQSTTGLTEFIDIYPSLCDLARIAKPSHLEGTSFVPLMKNPNLKWKQAAISRYKAGDTIRTDKFRFTEYMNKPGTQSGRMLYDHDADPIEDNNISESPAVSSKVQELTKQLRAGKGK